MISLTAALVIAGAIFAAILAAVVFAFVRTWRQDSAGPRLFAGPPVAGRHARPQVPSGAAREKPTTPAPGVTYGAFLPAPPAELDHDEYRPDQSWDEAASAPEDFRPSRRDGHARRDGGVLTPVLAPAALVVAVLRAHITAAIVADAQDGPFSRWESDTFVGGIPVVRL